MADGLQYVVTEQNKIAKPISDSGIILFRFLKWKKKHCIKIQYFNKFYQLTWWSRKGVISLSKLYAMASIHSEYWADGEGGQDYRGGCLGDEAEAEKIIRNVQ